MLSISDEPALFATPMNDLDFDWFLDYLHDYRIQRLSAAVHGAINRPDQILTLS
jgi:hypothetical protein